MPSINPNGVLAGQVAVITGASRGIGEAIAKRYAMEGAKVVVSARTVVPEDHFLPGSINETVQAIRDAGGEAVAVKGRLVPGGGPPQPSSRQRKTPTGPWTSWSTMPP